MRFPPLVNALQSLQGGNARETCTSFWTGRLFSPFHLFSRTPLRAIRQSAKLHAEPLDGLFSTREALPMRRGGFGRKAGAPCILELQ